MICTYLCVRTSRGATDSYVLPLLGHLYRPGIWLRQERNVQGGLATASSHGGGERGCQIRGGKRTPLLRLCRKRSAL